MIRVFRYSVFGKRDVLLFEMNLRLTRTCPLLRDAIRLGVLAYLALALGAGATLRNLHLESSEHGHRYCPEHEQIEAVEHGHGSENEQAAPRDLEEAGLRAGEQSIPDAHVACALLNALLSRAPVAPEPGAVSTPAAGVSQLSVALDVPFEPFDSILSFAPKTSPPFVTV